MDIQAKHFSGNTTLTSVTSSVFGGYDNVWTGKNC